MERTVSSRIALSITEPAELVFQVAVAGSRPPAEESVIVTLDGAPVSVRELAGPQGTRVHRLESGTGELTFAYRAVVTGEADVAVGDEYDLLVSQLPSRYAESDSLSATAHAQFAGVSEPDDVLKAVSSWVGTHLSYVPGSSLPTDGAVRTLLSRQGVCRDYAHLTIAFLRALGIPARMVAVYAPGLDPMDFHAVAEAWIDGVWRVVDATTLAPRSSLVRIATGRDAVDTAFLTVLSGRTELQSIEVSAVADVLPGDDLNELVSLR